MKMKTKAPKKSVKSVKKIATKKVVEKTIKAIEQKVNSKKQTGFLNITVTHSKLKLQDIKFSVNNLTLGIIVEIWDELGYFIEKELLHYLQQHNELDKKEAKKTTKKKPNTKKK